MHVSVPEPPHDWREFGVPLALVGQQLVPD